MFEEDPTTAPVAPQMTPKITSELSGFCARCFFHFGMPPTDRLISARCLNLGTHGSPLYTSIGTPSQSATQECRLAKSFTGQRSHSSTEAPEPY